MLSKARKRNLRLGIKAIILLEKAFGLSRDYKDSCMGLFYDVYHVKILNNTT